MVTWHLTSFGIFPPNYLKSILNRLYIIYIFYYYILLSKMKKLILNEKRFKRNTKDIGYNCSDEEINISELTIKCEDS